MRPVADPGRNKTVDAWAGAHLTRCPCEIRAYLLFDASPVKHGVKRRTRLKRKIRYAVMSQGDEYWRTVSLSNGYTYVQKTLISSCTKDTDHRSLGFLKPLGIRHPGDKKAWPFFKMSPGARIVLCPSWLTWKLSETCIDQRCEDIAWRTDWAADLLMRLAGQQRAVSSVISKFDGLGFLRSRMGILSHLSSPSLNF